MTARTGLRAQRLEFQLVAVDPIDLGRSPGSTLRGALVASLREGWPCDPPARDAYHWRECPTCLLLGAVEPAFHRGRDLPRPYAIEPRTNRAEAGEVWSFSLTLIGCAAQFEAMVVEAVAAAAGRGIGRKRGRSLLLTTRWISPTGGAPLTVLDDATLPMADLPTHALALTFHTPLRLIQHGRLVRQPHLDVLVQRLFERLEALSVQYGSDPPAPEMWQHHRRETELVASAAELLDDRTHWHDAWSGSKRTATVTPTGGLVGSAVWRGDLTPLLPWLRWGEALHVGKNAVKGDGWFSVESVAERGLPPTDAR